MEKKSIRSSSQHPRFSETARQREERKRRQAGGRRWRHRRVGAFEPLESAAPASVGGQRPPQAVDLLPTRHGGVGGRPANRTVVSRGFQEHCDKIQINTDARSNKIGEIKSCPFGEICWYFTDGWEQFRISGGIDVIDCSSVDPTKLQVVHKKPKGRRIQRLDG